MLSHPSVNFPKLRMFTAWVILWYLHVCWLWIHLLWS
jgi:hypothetical protein